MEKKESDIESLFEPQSIAVVGASQDPRKLGYRVLENIVHGGYQNPVYPINPRGGAILGVPVFPELEAVDRCIDTAVIVIPAAFVFESIRSCAAKGVKHAVIITSGFAEVGNSEEEKKIASYARDHGVRILGPNIFGIYSAAASLNATFSTGVVTPGTIAIITQSGALGASMIGKTAVENMGVSAMVSVGNKADIDESDLLEYLLGQERTKVILMYIEGVRNGERLLGTLTTATRAKPVIVIKAGRSAKGAVAAASHTGSLAGSDEVFDDLMKQCGAIRAETINEAFKWCRFLSHNPLPKGDHTVIITNGGGIGVMCADACEKYGVPLYDDPAALGETYADVVPEFGSKKNPIDLTGQATTAAFDDALTAAGKSADTDAVIALACEVAVFDPENLSHLIEKHCREYKRNGKALAFSFVGGERMEHCIRTYSAQGYPVFGDVYEAVSCVGALYSYHRYLSRRPDEEVTADIDLARIDETVRGVLVDKRNFVLSDEAREIMDAARIPMPTGRIAHSLDEAIQHSEEIGFPVVMKVVSKEIIHKSDVGGVVLDLMNREEVIDAYQAIMQNCRAYNPESTIKGVEISEMAQPGVEVIVGARKDSIFGPIVMFGLGGIYVEVMKDITFRRVPLDRKEVRTMMKEIRSYPLLLGVRGEEKKDIDGLVDIIIKLGTIIRSCPAISDIEINPVVAYEQGTGVKALDVRILLSMIER